MGKYNQLGKRAHCSKSGFSSQQNFFNSFSGGSVITKLYIQQLFRWVCKLKTLNIHKRKKILFNLTLLLKAWSKSWRFKKLCESFEENCAIYEVKNAQEEFLSFLKKKINIHGINVLSKLDNLKEEGVFSLPL